MNSRISRYVLLLDILWLVTGLTLSYSLRYGPFAPYPSSFRVLVLAAAGIWVLLSRTLPLDCFQGGWRFHVVLSRIVRATGLWMIFLIAFAYLTNLDYSAVLLVRLGVLFCLGFLLNRIGMYLVLLVQHRRGHT